MLPYVAKGILCRIKGMDLEMVRLPWIIWLNLVESGKPLKSRNPFLAKCRVPQVKRARSDLKPEIGLAEVAG